MDNRQDIFNKVAIHLITQKETSMSVQGWCMYRQEDSKNRCAVGVLIVDKAYNKELEFRSVDDASVQLALFKSGIDIDYPGRIEFLRKLQSIHDNNHPTTWANKLKDFAYANSLSIPQELQQS